MPTFTRVAVFNLNSNFVVLNTGGQITYSSDGINWTNASVGTGQTLRGAAYGLNTYIVVGDNGFMARATDLTSWQTVSTGTTQNLNSIEFAESRFRAVGAGGTVLSSTDGITFSPEISGTTQDLRTIRYTNSRWIAVGTNGTLITAVSGSGWTNPVPAIDSRPLYGIAYRAGMTYPYCAGKKVSTDGVTWTSVYNNISWPTTFGSQNALSNVNTDPFDGYIHAWNQGFLVGGKLDLGTIGTMYPGTIYAYQLLGYDGALAMNRWSRNGQSWSRETDSYFVGNMEASMFYSEMNGYLFKFLYDSGSGSRGGALSLGPNATGISAYTYGNNENNQGGQIVYMGDFSQGGIWHYLGSARFANPPNNYTRGVMPQLGAYGNGYHILISHQYTSGSKENMTASNWRDDAWRAGSNLIIDTSNWGNFTKIYTGTVGAVKWPLEIGPYPNSTTYNLLQADMCYGAGRFAVVGPRRNGATSTTLNAAGTKYFTVVYSTDNGATWNDRVFTESAGYDVGGRCAGSANEIVVSAKWYNNGTPGWVLRTTDCVNYTAYYTGYASTINEVKYLNGYFYTVHDNGGIARSQNGTTWTTLVAGTDNAIYGGTLTDVYFINSQYVVTNNASSYQTTTTLASYTNQPIGAGPFLYWDGTRLITCYGGDQLRTSTNGTTWTSVSSKQISSIAAKAGTYIAVQEGQSVFYRTIDLVNWTNINLNTTSGVGIIIKDSTGLERLQSYDATKSNYLCTRVIQEDYVTADNTTIYVTAANGYKIFVNVTPADSAPGGKRVPYIVYGRTGAPNYTPYYTVRYPAYGGSGSSVALSAVYCTVFTTGVAEKVSY